MKNKELRRHKFEAILEPTWKRLGRYWYQKLNKHGLIYLVGIVFVSIFEYYTFDYILNIVKSLF